MYQRGREPYFTFLSAVVLIVMAVGVGVFGWNTLQSSADPEPTVAISRIQSTPSVDAVFPTPNLPTPVPTTAPADESDAAESANAALVEPLTAQDDETAPVDAVLVFGVLDREDGCASFTDVAVRILANDLDIIVQTVAYEQANALYDDLSNNQIDVTLCFRDPADRRFLTQHVGFIKTLGAAYFDMDGIRLQSMANASNIVPLREQHPCALRMLQTMQFDNGIAAADGNQWITQNRDLVESWLSC